MQEECYHTLFRKKIHTTLEKLQANVDQWLETYNKSKNIYWVLCQLG
jgi:hypothetical protein